MNKKETSLYFQNGVSDKEYHVQLVEDNGLYTVNFQYGRRGGSLKAGSKTKELVGYEKALKIYQKLIKSKTAKGYIVGETTDIEMTNVSNNKIDSGVHPQLLNEINKTELLSYLNDDNFIIQEKKDGERRLIKKTKKETIAINKKGIVTNTTKDILNSINDECIIDGEEVNKTLYVFDILSLNGKDLKSKSYEKRLELLQSLTFGKSVQIVKTYYTKQEKEKFLEKAQKDNLEGIVLKNKNSKYEAGRPNKLGNQLKYKFYKTATVKVLNHTTGKRSVGMCMLDGQSELSVGKVTIPPNKEIPNIGDYIEVRYLYAYKGGSLFQPVFLEKRTDQDDTDIGIYQLIYKADV